MSRPAAIADGSRFIPVASNADWSTPAIALICWLLPIIESKPMIPPTAETITPVSTIQRRNWVKATAATPTILPNISSVALTLETKTSTTLLDFSSITEDITIPENIAMNI